MSTTRRTLIRDGAAVALGVSAAVPPQAGSSSDADLIALSQRFAAEQLAAWYLWQVTGDDAADAEASDFDTAALIARTPAITPEGWQAKALASVVWERTVYDMADDDGPAMTLLSSVLHDMVQPIRDAMLARLAAAYGPLPVEPELEPSALRPHPDAALIKASAEYCRLDDEFYAVSASGRHLLAGPEADAISDRGRALLNARDALDDILCDKPATTEAGRRAKARALRAYLRGYPGGANDNPDNNLAWSLLHDVLGEEPWLTRKGVERDPPLPDPAPAVG